MKVCHPIRSVAAFATMATIAGMAGLADGFAPLPSRNCMQTIRTIRTIGAVESRNMGTVESRKSITEMNAKRRGRLANNLAFDEEGNVAKVMTKREKQRVSGGRGKGKGTDKGAKGAGGAGGAAISPALAQWATSDPTDSSDGSVSTSAPTSTSSTSSSKVSTADADTFTSFDDLDDLKEIDEGSIESNVEIDQLLEKINDILSTTNCDVKELLGYVSSLVDCGKRMSGMPLAPTLKTLFKQSTSKTKKKSSERESTESANNGGAGGTSYRLAWAGSDPAICHIGTSLHKVPLARLQEVYLTVGGAGNGSADIRKNRWELLEVIRILGPFPNVRNTLRGEVTLEKKTMGIRSKSSGGNGGRDNVRMNIAYNSMIDGTGKELLAGSDQNVKCVSLDVWFASDKALVCTVPQLDGESGVSEGGREGGVRGVSGESRESGDVLLENNGANVLLFVAEGNLEESLEKLRAA